MAASNMLASPRVYSFVFFILLVVQNAASGPALQPRQSYCGGETAMDVGHVQEFASPYFPYAYPNGLQCLWVAYSPSNTAIRMRCDHFDVAPSQGCSLDVFYYSPSGDTSLQKSNYYCGNGKLDLTTTGNVFAAGFFSQNYYTNYYSGFHCILTVVSKTSVTWKQTPNPLPPVTTTTVTPPPGSDCQCGFKGGSRIVGGQDTEVNEWPWQAGLRLFSTGDIFCGASLIDKRWLVTAAHCVEQFKKEDMYVSLGDHEKFQNSDSSFTQHITIDTVIMHEKYNTQTVDNDIALIRLSGPVTFDDGIGPICLPFKYVSKNFSGEKGTVTGWGQLEFNGEVSNVLQEVELPILTTSECQKYELVTKSITDNMICTYKPGFDACKGDSGGPLQWGNGGRQYLIGLVSFGKGCADEGSPGVYTKVTNYLQWIQQKTSANLCSPL